MPTLSDFSGGINRRLPANRIPANCLQTATNVDLRNGRLEPLKTLGPAIAHGLGAGTWAWIWLLGSTWLGSTVARYQTLWQNTKLAYVTQGVAPPQWTNGSATESLGIARPTAACTAALGAAGNITGSNLTYVYTNVSTMGQESGPSLPSNAVSPTTQQVGLTGVLTGPAGTAKRKIYRVLAGTYLYAGEIANNTGTTFTDNVGDLSLGDPLLTEDAGPAPSLTCLFLDTYLGCMWGSINEKIYHSQPGAPEAWSTSWVPAAEPIVCGAYAGPAGMMALSAARPYLISGSITPGQEDVLRLEPAPNTFGCTAPFTLVSTDRGLIWWSTQGLVNFTGSEYQLLTAGAFDEGDIAGFSTTGMRGAYANGFYYLAHPGGILRCDLRSGAPVFTECDDVPGAMFVASNGDLYLAVGNDIKLWGAGATDRTMTILTGELGDETRPTHFRRHLIEHSGNLSVTLYSEGVAWGAANPVSRASRGGTYVWSESDDWAYRHSFGLTGTGTLYGITPNAEV